VRSFSSGGAFADVLQQARATAALLVWELTAMKLPSAGA
jgi:hypothetical protein